MSRLRRLARLGVLGVPFLGLACSQVPKHERTFPAPMHLLPDSPVDPAMSLTQNETSEESVRMASAPVVKDATIGQSLPISLDTVLRLAEEQNPGVGVARAKVNAAFAEKDAAAARWVPDIHFGFGWFRHQGGIQLQEGPLVRSSTGAVLTGLQVNAEYNPREYAFRQIEAARKVFQNQGELSKITYEQMLDATTTYVDLLAAHAALSISTELEAKEKELYEKAVKAFEMAKTAEFEIEKTRIESELKIQQQTQSKLRGQIRAASAKLSYLLGMDPDIELLPVDTQMVAFHIVDANTPAETLVSQALANGPGVRELESILCLINEGLDTANGPARWVPVVKLQMGEGLFGAGAGYASDWTNRWDLGVQARWNISELFQAKRKREVALAQMGQVQWTYQDLRAKLTLGVQEARGTSLAAAEQFPMAEELIKAGRLIVDKAKLRVDASVQGATYNDVLQAHKSVAMAQLNYVEMMREFDKAQLRLMALLGPGARPQ